MKKNILSAFLAVALFTGNAFAETYKAELTPYVSGKLAYGLAFFDQPVKAMSTYSGERSFGIMDKGNIQGSTGIMRLAYGLSTPLKQGEMRGEFEFSTGFQQRVNSSSNYIQNQVGRNEKVSITHSSQTAALNMYYDFTFLSDKVVPYIGAGLSISALHISSKVLDGNAKGNNYDTGWNVSVGAGYKMTERMVLDLGFRYSDLGSVSGSYYDSQYSGRIYKASSDIKISELSLGLRYSF